MIAEQVEVVIGVDTHKYTHTAAVVAAATGAVLAQLTVNTDPEGYQALVELADAPETAATASAASSTCATDTDEIRDVPGHGVR